jgi:hypothetical protein
MSLKKAAAGGMLFLASAAVPFALLAPRTAVSGVRAVSRWGGCDKYNSGGWWACAGVAGTDFPTSSVTGAYFEFIRYHPFSGSFNLKKTSYTGTQYVDSVSASFTDSGWTEIWVPANQVRANPSQWDFLATEWSAGSDAFLPYGVIYTN